MAETKALETGQAAAYRSLELLFLECRIWALMPFVVAGKLFPGPHLYAGAAIVVLWATAASLVPAMGRGNDTARTAHITLNSLNILLFAWQVRLSAKCPAQHVEGY